ncbi:hypothetical protein WJX72_006323 [[Myrmecia] bisecta]|uniref:CDP-diacylglycerol--inositol 3-phosphatidyltransferase n=1 Tax=[Myrmecia] bisecta TaxID=41462 RepID=A0AAW1Q7C6_9CHLO
MVKAQLQQHGKPPRPSAAQVLLYIPNIVGYVRLSLLLAACCTKSTITLRLFLANFLLDGLDGYLARRLQQTSAFGAFLDVFVDVLSRGTLWAWALEGPVAAVPILLEGITFTCTHKAGGAAWKIGCFADAPGWVRAVMANGFKTPLGALTVVGLMGCPLWFWARRFAPTSVLALPAVGCIVIAGRCLAAAVELWVIARHLAALVNEPPQEHDA